MLFIGPAFKWNAQFAYFFEGDQYLRYDLELNEGQSGYPKPIAGNWIGLPWTDGIDAVANPGDGNAYFFRKGEYARYSLGQQSVDLGPAPIAGNWPGLPWDRDLDAATSIGDNKIFFFRGAEYLRYDIGLQAVDLGPTTITAGWPGLPWQRDLDGAFAWNDNDIYFFQAGEYARFDLANGQVRPGYPKSVTKNWPKVVHFRFEPELQDHEISLLMRAHHRILSRFTACPSIDGQVKQALRDTYRRSILHGRSTDPSENGRAEVGGDWLLINFANLAGQFDELCQTLIHEFSHCANFTHPDKTSQDRPGDGGPYYGSVPLRCELCIAGQQSDLERTLRGMPATSCRITGRQAVIVSPQAGDPSE